MKKISGSLRLNLASFRELEAFAQLGTDLDAATRQQLERGKRLVEFLKQPQYRPMSMEHQVLGIYAGTKGFMDEIPVAKVRAFETGLIDFFESKHKGVLDDIRSTGKLEKDTVQRMEAGIKAYIAEFSA